MIWNFERFSGRCAVVTEDGLHITYDELNSAAEELARHVPERSLVFNLCQNSFGSLLGYASFVNNGIVPFLSESNIDSDLFEVLLETYQPDYLWIPSESKASFDHFETVFESYDYVLKKNPGASADPIFNDLALLLTTSGSTGSPKLVRQSYDNIAANTTSIIEYLKIDKNQRPITTLPMSYTYGLSIINTHLYAGASIILTDRTLMQREFWELFKEHKATSFGGVPYTYEMLDKLKFFRMDLPSLQTMTQAGGKLSPDLHKKYADYAFETGKEFVVMYGQTEATARMAYLAPEMAVAKYGSMGKAIPGGSFTLIDTDGRNIDKPDCVGELVYRGKNVTLGYAVSRADLSLGDERQGTLVTGDMAKMDTDGFYYIVGRKKRFLKIFGSRVNLDEVERLLRREFPEIDIACGGKDDELIVFSTGSDNGDLKRFLPSKLKLNTAGFKVLRVPEIPRSESGKVLYKELENLDVD